MRSPLRLAGFALLVLAASTTSTAGRAEATGPAVPRSVDADFNGDGFGDLAVGVPLEDIGSVVDAGAVEVLYGSASGLQAGAPADQLWTQDSPDVEDAPEPNDHFGTAVGTADFNGDGFADLAIGAPLENVVREVGGERIPLAGLVNVLYGSPSGLQATAPPDQLWSQETPNIVGLAEHGDQFGYRVAGGDFDSDGFDDLAVGVWLEDAGAETTPRAGAVNVIYGSAAGLQTGGDQHITQDDPGFNDPAEPQDHFGSALAAADFNMDSFVDLAVGVPIERIGTVDSAGAVHVLYGSTDGLQADDPDDQFLHQESEGIDDVAERLDRFGSALAAGDLDGDGFPDLAVGVVSEDVGTITDSGAVQLLYGSADGLQAGLFLHQDVEDVEGSAETADGFGTAVAAGDLDGDGTDDLAVGVPAEGVPSPRGGAVQVFYGPLVAENQAWYQDFEGVQDSSEFADRFGQAVAADDFSGDGFSDLAVGVTSEEVTGPADAGAVQVLYGSSEGVQANDPDDQLWTQDSPLVEDSEEASDGFGLAVA